jgi:hypothetical protein
MAARLDNLNQKTEAPVVLGNAVVLALATVANNPTVQVAVAFDTDLAFASFYVTEKKGVVARAIETELAAFEARLRSRGAEVALLHCGTDGLVIDHPFGAGISLEDAFRKARNTCPVTVDVLDVALEQLEWREGADKRIVVIGRSPRIFAPGKTTIEELVHRAERRGVFFDALSFAPTKTGWLNAVDFMPEMTTIAAEVRRFLERPSEALGRPPAHPRHATLIGGGKFHVVPYGEIDGPRELSQAERAELQKFVRREERMAEYRRLVEKHRLEDKDLPIRTLAPIQELLTRCYGPRHDDRDALDDLAEGRGRPDQVRNAELPPALAGVNLEPLLDAVFDAVDARFVLREGFERLEALKRGPAAGIVGIGVVLAEDVLASRKSMPSRR